MRFKTSWLTKNSYQTSDGRNVVALHMQQAMKHGKTLEPVWNDLDTFDISQFALGGLRGMLVLNSTLNLFR